MPTPVYIPGRRQFLNHMRDVHHVFYMRPGEINQFRVNSRPAYVNPSYYSDSTRHGSHRTHTRRNKSRGQANYRNQSGTMHLTPGELSGVIESVQRNITQGIERGISNVLHAAREVVNIIQTRTSPNYTTDQSRRFHTSHFVPSIQSASIQDLSTPSASIVIDSDPDLAQNTSTISIHDIPIESQMHDSEDEIINQVADEIERQQGKKLFTPLFIHPLTWQFFIHRAQNRSRSQ